MKYILMVVLVGFGFFFGIWFERSASWHDQEEWMQVAQEACECFLSWAKANKIKMGSIGDDDLSGLYAQIQCNRDESDCLRRELEKEQTKKEEFEALKLLVNNVFK